ncbi:hypothetical protein AOLI_G00171470 [Acnodon oligacanthus]
MQLSKEAWLASFCFIFKHLLRFGFRWHCRFTLLQVPLVNRDILESLVGVVIGEEFSCLSS